MKKDIIVTAKTVEEAAVQGASSLGVAREDVEIEVLEEPKKGFFGMGRKYDCGGYGDCSADFILPRDQIFQSGLFIDDDRFDLADHWRTLLLLRCAV